MGWQLGFLFIKVSSDEHYQWYIYINKTFLKNVLSIDGHTCWLLLDNNVELNDKNIDTY
jgi:hypothetical protein